MVAAAIPVNNPEEEDKRETSGDDDESTEDKGDEGMSFMSDWRAMDKDEQEEVKPVFGAEDLGNEEVEEMLKLADMEGDDNSGGSDTDDEDMDNNNGTDNDNG